MQPIEEYSYIYGAARVPIGKFNGALASASAPELGAAAIAEALKRSGVPKEEISEAIMGNVLSAGVGQAPARQAAIKSGLPYSVGATTVNKVCGSGLKAVMLADNAIRLRESRFVVAGGMENMSQAPYLQTGLRKGVKLGNKEMIDGLILDGLWDSFLNCHMGEIAETMARERGYSREAQDRFALESYRRARAAQDECVFSKEIAGVTVEGKLVEKDEQPYSGDLEKLAKLPPAFVKPGGTITAGNASKINDGAAALVLGPHDARFKPLARVTAQAVNSQKPGEFPIAPAGAIQKLLKKWRVGTADIDLFEINEAFAVTTMAVIDILGLDPGKVNVNGGAVALGHPIGASGARILVTLLYALRARNLRNGVAAICLGGGEALALGVEMIQG
ncbi:MAG: thiolase family protein [Nitrospinae bacterium]|nr:thiolase family protein [Nitrospinota bacterium]